MSRKIIRLPSPSMAVALVALLVALSGTAIAADVVPLAKRALRADEAKHATAADRAKRAGIATEATSAVRADRAKRALQADDAKRAVLAETAKEAKVAGIAAKLEPEAADALLQRAAAQSTELPGPASTAAGLISVKSVPWSLAPDGETDFTVACDPGQKAIAGGWEDPSGWGHEWDSRPTSDGAGWRIYVTVSRTAPGTQSGTLYAICLK